MICSSGLAIEAGELEDIERSWSRSSITKRSCILTINGLILSAGFAEPHSSTRELRLLFFSSTGKDMESAGEKLRLSMLRGGRKQGPSGIVS